jgi:hypothetical protein
VRIGDFSSRHAADMDVPARLRHHFPLIRLQGWTMRLAMRLAMAAGLWLVLGLAWAQRVEGDRAAARGMYEAEVPVNGQGADERARGFARALTDVLGKISGDRGAASRPGVGQELRRAGDFVKSYDYRQDEGRSASGAPTFRTTLIVRFDPAEVDAIAATLGLPVWPEPRPKPVLWLAIDDGRGPRLVALGQSDAARAVLDRAKARGYRLGLPSGSAAEQAGVGAIWRGDTGAIARLSRRYSPPMQLIGKLYRARGGGWSSDWIFVDRGQELSRWSTQHADARRAMAAGADGAADALSKKYAKAGAPVDPPGQYQVVIAGIDSADDYLRLASFLQGASVVRGIRPLRAGPGTIELELDLVTGLAGFRRAVAGGEVLSGGEGEPATFQLR